MCLRNYSCHPLTTIIVPAKKLHNHASSAIKEGEKVLAIAAKFIPLNEELPSGKSVKDLIKHVLDEM